MPLRIMLDITFAIKSLLSKDTVSYKAVFAAHFAVFKWLFMNKITRKINTIKINALTGVTKKMLVWQYFIKRKKHFKEIVNKNLS